MMKSTQQRSLVARRLGPAIVCWAVVGSAAFGQPPAPQTPDTPEIDTKPDAKPDTQDAQDTPKAATPSSDPAGLKRLMPKYDVWIDPKRKWVVVQGKVCLRRGALEMFACPAGTKEHESIVALNCKAWHIHAALVAVGAKPVHPVRFDPKYEPAKGTEVDIDVLWKDAKGNNRRVSARDWIVDEKDKTLRHPWVFGGSRFFKDEMTGQEIYLAEDGDLICVSNFTTATLDLPIESTADTGSQLFYAKTDAIPEMETYVRLVLMPKLEKKPDGEDPMPSKNDPPSPTKESTSLESDGPAANK